MVRQTTVGLLVLAAISLTILVLLLSITLLPSPPQAPTPTLPKGIELPELLPRIPR